MHGDPVVVAALYKFSPLADPASLQAALTQICEASEIVGTLLLAKEGINGTIAGPAPGIDEVLAFLRKQPGFEDLEEKRSYAPQPPFYRMKVRLKPEIVSMGDPEIDPTQRVGTYVDPRRFDELLDDPEVLVIDTRNHYEVRLGTFDGALDPKIDNFRAFPDWVKQNLNPTEHRKVAMFCTGGIRCEKASSLMLREGFEEVYHLEGGILRYLETTEAESSRWQGECFVFDHRVSVNDQLTPGSHRLCFGCLEPVSKEDATSPQYEYGVSCPRCFDDVTEDDRARRRERARQMTLAETSGRRHIGAKMRSSSPSPHAESSPDGILYSFRRCPYAMRARMALAAGGLNPEIREVALKAKPAAMLALGSTTVPVWQLADGEVVHESIDIMHRVRAHHPAAMAFAPNEDLARLIEAIDGPFKFALDRYKYPTRYPDEDTSNARDRAVVVLREVERLLGERPFLDGAQAGFHDAAVFPFVRQFAGVDSDWFASLARGDQPDGDMPGVVAWRARMAKHPWFRQIMKKLPPWQPDDTPTAFADTLISAT
ncbi:MAG: rhodanese-related sulfurtransferase [Myxococcota bacterium]